MNSRRNFLKQAGVGVALGAISPSFLSAQTDRTATAGALVVTPSPVKFQLGMASYTIRKYPLDQALAMVQRLGLSRMVFKDAHLPLTSSDDEIQAALEKAKAKGIEVYGCGTVYMKTPAEIDQAFHYAQTAGMKLIIGAPNVELLPLVEQKVKETDITLAIHNHGPDNPLYSSALDAYALIKGMDRRMGLCLDIGHTQRLGQDPIAVFRTVFDRVYDIHTKDVTAASKAGKTCEGGRGVIDLVGFIKTAIALGYAHTLDFEHEKDADDPLPGVAETIGYVRGLVKLLSA
jgi:inosose dehydratase